MASELPYYGNKPTDVSSSYNFTTRFSGHHSAGGNIVFGDGQMDMRPTSNTPTCVFLGMASLLIQGVLTSSGRVVDNRFHSFTLKVGRIVQVNRGRSTSMRALASIK